METKNMNIGWIGTGVMGAPMVGHLLTAGHALFIATRTPSRAADLVTQGATLLATPAEVADRAEVVFTMVSYPDEVEEVYFGESGIFSRPSPALRTVIDMSTTRPSLAIRIARHAESLGVQAIDAPVSGGWLGAINGTLAIMVGGTEEAFDQALPLLRVFGQSIARMGSVGAGQHTKLGNQILVAGTMIGLCESLVYAAKQGLDLNEFMAAVGGGAAACWSLSNLGPKIVAGDYAPGFYIDHFIKDLGIVLEECRAVGLNLPGTDLALTLYREASRLGHGRHGTQALIEAIRSL